MKKIGYTLFTFFVINTVAGQQKMSYDNNAEKRSVGSFHGIKVATGIKLMISQGNTEEVAVSAANIDDRNKIKTEVVNGVLKIYFNKENNWGGWNGNKKNLKAWVSFKSIDEFNGSSGSSTIAEGIIKAGNLILDISSGADFKGSINCSSLNVELSSGADANVSGNSEKIVVKASSGSDFKGFALTTKICDADASSGADIEITVQKEIKAEASSGGGVYYKGTAIITSFSKSSGGSINKEN